MGRTGVARSSEVGVDSSTLGPAVLSETFVEEVDVDGDNRDEMFFYRADGLYAYYDVNANGTLGRKLSGGTGYTKNMSSITAVDVNG